MDNKKFVWCMFVAFAILAICFVCNVVYGVITRQYAVSFISLVVACMFGDASSKLYKNHLSGNGKGK